MSKTLEYKNKISVAAHRGNAALFPSVRAIFTIFKIIKINTKSIVINSTKNLKNQIIEKPTAGKQCLRSVLFFY